MKWPIRFAILCLAIQALASSSTATTIIPATLEYMTDFCDTIVLAEIEGKYSYWEEKTIYTDVVIRVQSFLKKPAGPLAAEMTFRFMGGTVGPTTLEVDGAPDLIAGEKAILFLKTTHKGLIPFAGEYGVFKVRFDPGQQKEVVDGAFFQYAQHFDLKTKPAAPVSEPFVAEGDREVKSFVARVKGLVK